MSVDSKRQNFNVDADQAADLELARANLHAPTIKDAMLRAARLVNVLAKELESGSRLMLVDPSGQSSRLILSDLEDGSPRWKYLCARPHPWRRQLYVKGRKLLASTVVYSMEANNQTPEEAADDRDLPLEAVLEAVRYCELDADLIRMEAEEEKAGLLASGISLTPPGISKSA